MKRKIGIKRKIKLVSVSSFTCYFFTSWLRNLDWIQMPSGVIKNMHTFYLFPSCYIHIELHKMKMKRIRQKEAREGKIHYLNRIISGSYTFISCDRVRSWTCSLLMLKGKEFLLLSHLWREIFRNFNCISLSSLTKKRSQKIIINI